MKKALIVMVNGAALSMEIILQTCHLNLQMQLVRSF